MQVMRIILFLMTGIIKKNLDVLKFALYKDSKFSYKKYYKTYVTMNY